MTYETQLFLQLIALWAMWICGPLVPAILIYVIFPDTKVVAQGPLAGLTFKATGAFAAYVVTFLMVYPLSLRLYDVYGSQLKSVWTLKAEVVARNENGEIITYSNFYDGMRVSFSPDIQTVTGRNVTLRVPMDGSGRNWPSITFQLPNYGGKTIDPANLEGNRLEIDKFRKEIIIHGAIPLERFVPIGSSLAAGGRQP